MPTEVGAPHQVVIEPFDPSKHDRTAFSCGVSRLDNFLKASARKQQRDDFTRIWVAVRPQGNSVIGYYAINSHSLLAEGAPEQLTKNAPRHGQIPAAYLSMICVNKAEQGGGIGSALLIDALQRIAKASQQLGIAAIILDILDDDGPQAAERRRKFYESMQFQSFPSQPLRMFLPIAIAKKLLV